VDRARDFGKVRAMEAVIGTGLHLAHLLVALPRLCLLCPHVVTAVSKANPPHEFTSSFYQSHTFHFID
jgi:hypothetical protein